MLLFHTSISHISLRERERVRERGREECGECRSSYNASNDVIRRKYIFVWQVRICVITHTKYLRWIFNMNCNNNSMRKTNDVASSICAIVTRALMNKLFAERILLHSDVLTVYFCIAINFSSNFMIITIFWANYYILAHLTASISAAPPHSNPFTFTVCFN